MSEVTCPGWPADWVNAWLAAVGATVLDERIRLRWTDGAEPTAVLVSEAVDPVEALIDSWPDEAMLSGLPIAEHWQGAPALARKVSVDEFAERARAVRGSDASWTLSSTMTDLSVDEHGEVAHAPFDPAGPGTIKWLHHRLLKVHRHVEDPGTWVAASMSGAGNRVQDNGLGFDQRRIGSLSDKTDPWVDPVVEVLAFFGLAILPMRGHGRDRRLDRRADVASPRQRAWRQIAASPDRRNFCWPAWSQPLDSDGIDALMDAWNPDRRHGWERLGVHDAWRSVQYESRSRSDTTRAIGGVRL